MVTFNNNNYCSPTVKYDILNKHQRQKAQKEEENGDNSSNSNNNAIGQLQNNKIEPK